MYAIIYWTNNDEKIFFVTNEDGSIKVFDKLKEADSEADKVNDSRVISLDGVSE
jgi:hypothetical protein